MLIENSEFSTILDHLGAGILVEISGKPVYANSELARIFNYSHSDDILDLPSWLLIAAEEERDRMGRYAAARVGGEDTPKTYQFQGITADGRAIQLSNHSVSILWQGKAATLATILDITEQQKTAVELRTSEKRYHDIMDGSIQGVLIAAIDRKPLAANRMCAEIFGYGSVEEILALESTHALIAPHEIERLNNIRKPYEDGRTRDPIAYEFEGVRKDGSLIDLNLHGSAIEWEGQMASHLTLVDVTVRKQAEVRLLEKTIEAEHANRQKSEFLAHMSHELRTPLNAIIGFSQMITDEIYGKVEVAKYREYASDILGSGHHLLHLINDILDLSKIEAGEFTLFEENVDVDELLKSSLAMIKGRCESRSITFHYGHGAISEQAFPKIRDDERLIRQIVLNLLSNAVKYNSVDGTVRLSSGMSESGAISISVTDTGVGIAENDLTRVMASFIQIRTDSQISHEGTGLGLSLSRQLAELHGGTLELESELGRGTTATITFPPERTIPNVP
ncbi:MAG: PAS domain S-box protein [Alphaproteobacteria bacterium]|nr:PAS domain S-box protein [Alphaproteobacteria bacterium]